MDSFREINKIIFGEKKGQAASYKFGEYSYGTIQYTIWHLYMLNGNELSLRTTSQGHYKIKMIDYFYIAN